MINLQRMRILIGVENRIQEKRAYAFSRATKITPTLTGMPHGSRTHSQTESGALDLAEIDDAYAEVYADLEAMRAELSALLPALDDPDDIAVIRYRYMMGIPLRTIPDLMCVSERSMFYHLSTAEHKLVRMYPGQVALK